MDGQITAPSGLPPGSDPEMVNTMLQGMALYGDALMVRWDQPVPNMPFGISRNGVRPARELDPRPLLVRCSREFARHISFDCAGKARR